MKLLSMEIISYLPFIHKLALIVTMGHLGTVLWHHLQSESENRFTSIDPIDWFWWQSQLFSYRYPSDILASSLNHLQNWKKGGVSQKTPANKSKPTQKQSKNSVCVHNYPQSESLGSLMKYGKDKCRDRKKKLLNMMEKSILESPTYPQWTFQALILGKPSLTVLS